MHNYFKLLFILLAFSLTACTKIGFSMIDKDSNGLLSQEEMESNKIFSEELSKSGITVKDMIKALDENNDKQLSFKEFDSE